MIRQDDRTESQKKTYYLAVVMRDSFLSNWGRSSGGYSRCCWAIDATFPDSSVILQCLENWVRSRREAKYVNVIDLRKYRPKNTAHFHIYVVRSDHPSLYDARYADYVKRLAVHEGRQVGDK